MSALIDSGSGFVKNAITQGTNLVDKAATKFLPPVAKQVFLSFCFLRGLGIFGGFRPCGYTPWLVSVLA